MQVSIFEGKSQLTVAGLVSHPYRTQFSLGPALTVVGNPELLSIEFSSNVQFFDSHPHIKQPFMAIIRGNRKLVKESIDEIVRVFQSYRFIKPVEGGQSGYV